MQPLFSIIIPTRHRNDSLSLCLERLAPGDQTTGADHYEVIVTDDGSATAQAMVQKKFPWARWIAGPRLGPAANRNHGAAYAKGKWLVFTDDDCVPCATWLEGYQRGLVEGIQAYEGRTTCEEGIHSPLFNSPMNETGGAFWSCNIMLNRQLFLDAHSFDTDFIGASNEDVDLRERLKSEGHTIKFVVDAVVNHPPRPLPQGVEAGKMHESQVQLWYKAGGQAHFHRILLRRIMAERMRYVARFRLQPDSIKSLTAATVEFFYVMRHIGEWEQRYRRMYQDRLPPYPYPY